MAGIGEALRSTRERRGLSIDQVAQDTRISPRFLEALEAEQFNELPAPVYVRGFLRSYANYLRIEPQPLLDRLIGGDLAMPGGAEGYAGTNGRAQNGKRKNDPFQRGGVIAPAPPPPPPILRQLPPEPDEGPEDDGWAPEPPAPFSPAPVDHGYIPGSDLMEAPERHGYEEYAEPEPLYRPRTPGVLAERPPGPIDPGIPRKVAIFGGGVAAVLGFLLLAVFVTRGDDDGPNNAAATGSETPGITPGTVIPLSSATSTATPATAPSASASATAATTVTASATIGTVTPRPTTSGPAAASATPTPTETSTQAPTATPTPFVPTATPVAGPPPHPSTYAACDITRETEKCGSANVRVICYPPFGEDDPRGFNDNWFVDVTGAYPIQPTWRETNVFAPVSIGPVIKAGQYGCR